MRRVSPWRTGRKVAPEPAPPRSLWKIPAFAATMLLCLVMVGNGVRPQVAEAPSGQTRTLVCPGPDCEGQISPDGKSLLTWWNGDIGVRDLVTKQIRRIADASGAHICCAHYSPDGLRVAYSRYPVGPQINSETAQLAELIAVNADGTNSRSLYRGGFVTSWSPDGKRLLVGDRPPDQASNPIWVGAATGGVQRLGASHAGFGVTKISPDGKWIAFSGSKDENTVSNVFVMASDGTGETIVWPSAAFQAPVEWTADGKYLVFAQYGATVDLWTARIADGKIQGPATNTHVALPKDVRLAGTDRSGAIYYRTISSTSDIFTASMDLVSGRVTSPPIPVPVERTGANALPRWAPDSRRLLYNWVYPLTTGTSEVRELYVYSFDPGKDQRIAEQAKLASGAFCWSSDGSSLLFNSGENPRQPEVARFNWGTNQITPVFPGSKPFALRSCSGDLVAGVQGSDLVVRNLSNGSEKAIYKFNPGTHPPVISHDGRSVAFVDQVAASGVLRVMSSQGGEPRDLAKAIAPADFQALWGVTWSPDDRFVYFARRSDNKSPYELLRMPAAGGAEESMGLKLDDLRDLNISPDGKRIAFSIGAVNRPEIWALRGFLPAKK